MRIMMLFTAFILVTSQNAFSQLKEVSLKEKNLHWIGRVTDDFTFGWGGSGVHFNTTAKEISIEIDCKLGPAYLNIITNDDIHFVRIENGTYGRNITVKNPKPINSIHIIKSTEAHTGHMRFKSLKMDGELKSPTIKKRVLFIGDSITCGYGNLSKSHKEHYKPETEDVYYTYGFVAARKMGWEFNSVAWSGKGALRNYGKGDDEKRYKDTLPLIYERALPHKPNSKWDFKKNVPDLICVNLGTNDNAGGNLDKKKYVDAYRNFVKRIRQEYPGKPIVGLVGPLYNNKQYEYMAEWTKEAFDGMENTHVIQLPKGKGQQDLGADWHPNKNHHQRMGEFLGPELLKIAK